MDTSAASEIREKTPNIPVITPSMTGAAWSGPTWPVKDVPPPDSAWRQPCSHGTKLSRPIAPRGVNPACRVPEAWPLSAAGRAPVTGTDCYQPAEILAAQAVAQTWSCRMTSCPRTGIVGRRTPCRGPVTAARGMVHVPVSRWQQGSGKQMTGMRNSRRAGEEPRPQFKPALRGYAAGEVADFLARLSDDPDPPVPAFARVMRGYDPEQVDLYIEHVKALWHRPLP